MERRKGKVEQRTRLKRKKEIGREESNKPVRGLGRLKDEATMKG